MSVPRCEPFHAQIVGALVLSGATDEPGIACRTVLRCGALNIRRRPGTGPCRRLRQFVAETEAFDRYAERRRRSQGPRRRSLARSRRRSSPRPTAHSAAAPGTACSAGRGVAWSLTKPGCLPDIPFWVVGDRDLASDAFCERIWHLGAWPAIPPKKRRSPARPGPAMIAIVSRTSGPA